MPTIDRALILGIFLAATAPATLRAQEGGRAPPARLDTLRARPRTLQEFLDLLARRGALPRLECPMPVARVGGGAAFRLTFPPDTARTRTRPVPMPTVPSGCVNPLRQKP